MIGCCGPRSITKESVEEAIVNCAAYAQYQGVSLSELTLDKKSFGIVFPAPHASNFEVGTSVLSTPYGLVRCQKGEQ